MEYVDMGRVWKGLIALGFGLWIAALLGWYGNTLRGALHPFRAGRFLALVDDPSLVEGIFAVFQTAVTAVVFLNLRLVSRELVTRTVYLEGFLVVVLAGTLAVGHHYWWIGEPAVWISIGSVFSTLEVVPLFLLLFHALGTYHQAASGGCYGSHSLTAFISN